jgi:hypothetical protein
MLLNRDSAIQSASRKFYPVYKSEILVPCQPSRRRVIPSGRPTVQSIIRPNDVDFRPDLLLCREASNCSSLHPFGRFRSPSGRPSVFDQSFRISFQNTNMGRLLQQSRRRGFSFGRSHL